MEDTTNARRNRIIGLISVLFIAFAIPLSTSFYVYFAGPAGSPPVTKGDDGLSGQFLFAIMLELLALGALILVLSKQGRKLSTIGLSFSWRDIPESVLLAVAALAAATLTNLLMYYCILLVTRHPPNLDSRNLEFLDIRLSVPFAIFLFINPWYEELIARAFLMTESIFLFGEKDAAVLLSVILQSSYHLYQGVPATISIASIFLVFSLFYAWRGRILPVVLAHLFIDVIGVSSHIRW